jgi:hypothetical protein
MSVLFPSKAALTLSSPDFRAKGLLVTAEMRMRICEHDLIISDNATTANT